MAKKAKKPNWLRAEDAATYRWEQNLRGWSMDARAFGAAGFAAGFQAGLRAMRRHLKKAGTP